MATKEERDQARLDRLEAKKERLVEQQRKQKKKVQALQKESRRKLNNEIARARTQVRANERKIRTRRLIVTGGAVEAEAEADPAFGAWLRELLERRLKRDQDRALVGLDPLPVETPESAPEATGEKRVPLPGWKPARLPDGSWGSRHNDPVSLPEVLVGRTIEITARNGDSWTATVQHVVLSSETHILVQDSGLPAR